jgi:ABC-type lipoprotein export system ATPase subunit
MEQNDHKKLVCVIVGTNRSGKTTIFNLLSRSDQAQSSEEIIIPKNITLS